MWLKEHKKEIIGGLIVTAMATQIVHERLSDLTPEQISSSTTQESWVESTINSLENIASEWEFSPSEEIVLEWDVSDLDKESTDLIETQEFTSTFSHLDHYKTSVDSIVEFNNNLLLLPIPRNNYFEDMDLVPLYDSMSVATENLQLNPEDILSMIQVESGGHRYDENSAFSRDPLSVAHQGDALPAVLTLDEELYSAEKEQFRFFLPEIDDYSNLICAEWTDGQWDYQNSTITAEQSINVGVGWLTHRHANYGIGDFIVEGAEEQIAFVESGDNLTSIAREYNTTVNVLVAMNPEQDPHMLNIGDEWIYKEATICDYVESFKEWDVDKYNGGGDKEYSKKIDMYLAAMFINSPNS